MSRDTKQLRQLVDPNDSFIQGHQVAGPRKYRQETPTWVLNDKEIQKILLRSFPRLAIDRKQRRAAARWAMVIHRYYRLGYTKKQIAEEMNLTVGKVKSVLRSIYRVFRGQRANGTGPRGGKRTGRPKVRAPESQHY